MQVCDQCNTEIKVVYICPKCGGRFCREHKKPENHNCIKVNTPANIIEETQTYEEPYENTSTDITEETNTYEDSYENTPINIIDETQTHEEIYENNSIVSHYILALRDHKHTFFCLNKNIRIQHLYILNL